MSDLATIDQEAVAEVNQEVSAVVQRAQAIEVSTPEQAQDATAFLGEIAKAKRKSETARKFLVDPLNAHVKAINARFKSAAEPLDEADELVRGKVIAFQRVEAARVAAEQARIDAERRAEEERVERERRAAAAEAARIEREAAAAEQARQAKLREAANERARELAAMSDQALEGLMEQLLEHGDEAEAKLVEEEFTAREARTLAEMRAADARREAEEATQREIASKSAPAAPVVEATKLAGTSGTKRWKATVVDPALVPRKYLIVDERLINADMKAGVREIPGVRIEQIDGLAVRA
jgi:hypothetical protein